MKTQEFLSERQNDMTRFEMTYTKSDIKSFFDETSKKKVLKNLIMTYSVVGIVIFSVFLIVSFSLSNRKALPFIFIGVFILFTAWAILRTLKNASDKMYKNLTANYDGGIMVSCFEKDRFYTGIIPAEADEEASENTNIISEENMMLYSAIEKVVESDNYFYIFANAKSAQIIRKSALTEGSIEEVRENLKKSLNEKYEDITKLR